MEKSKIGFIGAGNMAGAIIKGILKSKLYDPRYIYICDINKDRCDSFRPDGIRVATDALDVVVKSDIIFLAVKPQNYEEILTQIKPAVTTDKVFVSIAAGISTDYIKNKLQLDCPVVRVMPNTPLLIGKGATALCAGSGLSKTDFDKVKSIFAASSDVEVITEDKMNAVIAINGSSPAYIYLFAKAVIDYAVSMGIDSTVALNLICKTLEGSAGMLKISGYTPDELIKMVSSPGGTTIAAMKALDENGFYDGLIEAMNRCTKRALELDLK